MVFTEDADYDPVEIEKYCVSNMQFFKRWTLNNVTLNQLNSILIEQQMMPASAQSTSNMSRVGFCSISEEGTTGVTDTGRPTDSMTALGDTSKMVSLRYFVNLPTLTVTNRSAWVVCSSPSLCLSACPEHNSKTKNPKMFELRR